MATTKQYTANIPGLNKLLKSIKDLGPEALLELKAESNKIAGDLIVPAYQNAARTAGGWGDKMAASVRVRKGNIPGVQIGYAKKVYSGGGSTIMLRHATSSGHRKNPAIKGNSWIREAEIYKVEAMARWGRTIDEVLIKWGRGQDY